MESKVYCVLVLCDCDCCAVVICRSDLLPLVTAVADHPFAVLDLQLRSNSEGTYLLAVNEDPLSVEGPVVTAVSVLLHAYDWSYCSLSLRTLRTGLTLRTFVTLVTLLTILECVSHSVCECDGESVAHFSHVLDIEVVLMCSHECLDEFDIAVEVLAELFKVCHPVLKVFDSAGQFVKILTCAECQHCSADSK